MKSHTKPSTSLLRDLQIHQAYASTNVRKNLDTTRSVLIAGYWAHPFLLLPNPLEYRAPLAAGTTFLDVLLRRRTFRSFAPDPLDAGDLSALLFYVWGATSVQRNDFGDIFLRKTSPAGGSLHGTEVILMNVEGFEPGLYHYSVRRHGLVLLSRQDSRDGSPSTGSQRHVAGNGSQIPEVPRAVETVFVWVAKSCSRLTSGEYTSGKSPQVPPL
jgi:hypothetical protein